MQCPKCKQEVTGKYCSFCGTLLESDHIDDTPAAGGTDSAPGSNESSDTGSSGKASDSSGKSSGPSGKSSGEGAYSNSRTTVTQTVTQKTKVKKKKKKKGKISGAVSGSISKAGSITTGSVRTIWKTALAVIQWITAGLMLFITWKLFQGLWAQRTALGSLTRFIQERNINQAAYLAISVCLIAFGILQALWIVTRKKMPDNGKVRRLDMGRGIFGFLVFLLLALAALYVTPMLPEYPRPLPGIKQVLNIISGMGKTFIMLNVLGIVLCIVRKAG